MSAPLVNDVEQLRLVFSGFAKASLVLEKEDHEEAKRCAVILQTCVEERAKEFVMENRDWPILYSYQSDMTSYSCAMATSTDLGGGRVMRDGRVLTEFLLERGFLLVRTPTGTRPRVLLKCPRVMFAGKSAWHKFAAACKFFGCLRSLGHASIIVNHLAADRAVLSALGARLRTRVYALYDTDCGEYGRDEDLCPL